MPQFGPYEQPGWPSSLPYYKPAETFRNAFGMASEINRRKQQLENQLMAMSLREQQNQFMNGLRQEDFQRKLEQGQQREDIAYKMLGLREQIHQDTVNRYNNTIESMGNLATGLGAIPLEDTDPGMPSAVMKVASVNSAGVKAAPWMVKSKLDTYNHAVRTARNSIYTDYRGIEKEVKDTVGAGQSSSFAPLYNLDAWQTKWRDKNTGADVGPPVTEQQKKDYVDTGEKFFNWPSSTPGAPPQPVTLPWSKVLDLNKRLRAIDTRLSKTGEQVSNEYTTAIPMNSGGLPTPTDSDMAYLKSHPDKAKAFDARFGSGTSSQILNQ